MNSLSEQRHWPAHISAVTSVFYSTEAEMIFSCSKDKTAVWHCSETSVKIGSFVGESSFTALEFDAPSKFVFLGDSNGSITILRLNGPEATVVSTLSAHTKSITSLAWDMDRQLLYSAATDHLVIMWDIGGKKGQAFELNSHNSSVTCLQYALHAKRLFSADDSGSLVCWDMAAKRVVTPEWKTSDSCQLLCANCCSNTTRFPPMGYELPVRTCNACHSRMQQFPDQFDLTPLAIVSELRQGVTCMHLQESTGRLVTAGVDRVLMIWDVKQLV
ncbi:unnamed protein product [Gongylonema pulchrum]|uniref:FYVE zinc finger domain-containing protein n=1 Tax=Gongylonema pulchrum TaxID=637853 RepID=A0A3P7MAW6_9BILA|nr:unnamed protein product [Gongylonema pulchrum]